MKYSISFKARGHPNIRSRHRTTLMTTVENSLTSKGDCIVAVSAEMGLAQLSPEIKEVARNPETRIIFTLNTGKHKFVTTGTGHAGLTYSDPSDMVARKSNYVCGRTLMVNSDKAAIDLPIELVKSLQDPETEVIIELTYEIMNF
jgi:hypothetical protein